MPDQIDVHPAAALALQTDGLDNHVTVGAPLVCGDCTIDVGGGSQVHIAAGCVLTGLLIYARAGAVIRIGGASGFNGFVKILAHERAKISIGETCLFGDGVHITVSDMHSILDQASGQRINPAVDVVINDHVWIGQGSLVLKGALIGANSVVGAASIVTGELPGNSLCVGSPARAIRSGITWKHELV